MSKSDDSPEVLARFHGELELVEILARQVARNVGPHAELQELVSYGREGLLDAARRFDPERGVPFRAYANFRVKGAIIDGVRSMARLPRRVHARLQGLAAAARQSEGAVEDLSAPAAPGATRSDADVALSEHLAGMATAIAMGLVANTAHGEDGERVGVAQGASPEDTLGHAQLIALVRDAIAGLPDQEAELVRRHYLEGERFDHVAADLGLSKSWASRLHTRAIGRLTKRLRGANE
ncbi:MAG: sigma-70 family RNA polymerase sigma factor [Myxococcales bacterium]|nr:sigma-70 family RNA polymerase sigma factor [Myxococcales bacterium]